MKKLIAIYLFIFFFLYIYFMGNTYLCISFHVHVIEVLIIYLNILDCEKSFIFIIVEYENANYFFIQFIIFKIYI